MQFSKSLSALLLTLLPISTLALPTEVKLPHLPRGIRDDLLKRHPSTYQVGGFGDLSARDVQGLLETHAQRRGRLEGRASQNDGLKTRCTVSNIQSKWEGEERLKEEEMLVEQAGRTKSRGGMFGSHSDTQ